MNAVWVEWLGYLASLVVLISLLMSSLVRLRWINLAGAALFSLYGFIIGALPVALVNLAIALIDIYYLYLHYSARERFDVVEADRESELFAHLLERYGEEIEHQLPLSLLRQCQKIFYILNESEIVGMMAGDRIGDRVDLRLDYAFPRYRDYRMGEYFFLRHPELFKARGIRKILTRAPDEPHRNYLKKMGFRPLDETGAVWEKEL